MTLVRIDRSTLRRNPDAGKTTTLVPSGIQSGSFTIERDGRAYVLDVISTPAVWEQDGIVGTFFCRAATGPMPHAFPCGETTEGKVGGTDKLVMPEFSREMLEIHHQPEPPWLYEHEPTPVTCNECGETFDSRQLKSDYAFSGPDGDEIWSSAVCPHCGEWDCCDVEYESPRDVL